MGQIKTTLGLCAILCLLAIPTYIHNEEPIPTSIHKEEPVVVYEFFSYMDNTHTDGQPRCIDPKNMELFWVVPGGTRIGSFVTNHNGFWIEESTFRLLTQDLLDAEIHESIDLYLWY